MTNGPTETDNGRVVTRIDVDDPQDPAIEGWKVVFPSSATEAKEAPGGSEPDPDTSPAAPPVYFPDEVYGSVDAAYTAAVFWSRRCDEEPDWTDTTNISRVDTGPDQGNTHGDFVRVQRQGKLRKKFFSDSHFGGERGARHAALIWRDMIKDQLPEALDLEAGREESAIVQSQFGLPGMSVIRLEDTHGLPYPALQIRWTTASGETQRHVISLRQWGPRRGVWKAAQRLIQAYEGDEIDTSRSFLFSALPDRFFAADRTSVRVQNVFDEAYAGVAQRASDILSDRQEQLRGIPSMDLRIRKRNGRYVPRVEVTYERGMGRTASRAATLGPRSTAKATRRLCGDLVEAFERYRPGPTLVQSDTSPFSVFDPALDGAAQVDHLFALAYPALEMQRLAVWNAPPGFGISYHKLESGRYSPMLEVTWQDSNGEVRRRVASILRHGLRPALLQLCTKVVRAFERGDIGARFVERATSPFANLGEDEIERIRDVSPESLAARLYRAALPRAEALYHLAVVHGAPGVRVHIDRSTSSDIPYISMRWPSSAGSWVTRSVSVAKHGLEAGFRELCDQLAGAVAAGDVDLDAAFVENAPLRALDLPKDKVHLLDREGLADLLMDELFPVVCAYHRMETRDVPDEDLAPLDAEDDAGDLGAVADIETMLFNP